MGANVPWQQQRQRLCNGVSSVGFSELTQGTKHWDRCPETSALVSYAIVH